MRATEQPRRMDDKKPIVRRVLARLTRSGPASNRARDDSPSPRNPPPIAPMANPLLNSPKASGPARLATRIIAMAWSALAAPRTKNCCNTGNRALALSGHTFDAGNRFLTTAPRSFTPNTRLSHRSRDQHHTNNQGGKHQMIRRICQSSPSRTPCRCPPDSLSASGKVLDSTANAPDPRGHCAPHSTCVRATASPKRPLLKSPAATIDVPWSLPRLAPPRPARGCRPPRERTFAVGQNPGRPRAKPD